MKNEIMSLESKLDISQDTYRILKATFYLTEEDMINALLCKHVMINGVRYETPRKELLELLTDGIYGCIELELTEA